MFDPAAAPCTEGTSVVTGPVPSKRLVYSKVDPERRFTLNRKTPLPFPVSFRSLSHTSFRTSTPSPLVSSPSPTFRSTPVRRFPDCTVHFLSSCQIKTA